MFPVLPLLVEGDENSGHYFLIVLNRRNKRFELLDSMSSLGDSKLAGCCNTIISVIKRLWRTHYADTNNSIDNYEVVDIGVPKKTNK